MVDNTKLETPAPTESVRGWLATRRLFGYADFRRLLWCRLTSQWADGVFQAGLAGAVLFNPEREANPLAIAGGFAVILVPYSVIGPFAGALLDRWDRRRLLIITNLIRIVLILLAAAADGFGLSNIPLYAAALLVMGTSRFVLTGLSASLPHVTATRELALGNSIVATLGAAATVVGAACGFGLRNLLGIGNVGSALITSVSVLGVLAAALFTAQFRPKQLGPDTVDEPSVAILAVVRGMVDGAKAALRTPSVISGFIGLFTTRLAFGASLLVIVLLLKYSLHSVGPFLAGAGGLGEMAAAGGAGILLAGALTPRLIGKFGRKIVVGSSLVIAGVSLVALGLPMVLPTVLVAAFVVTASSQVVKLSADNAVQQDIHDESRGRVFAVQDTLYNIAQVLGAAATAAIIPMDGRAPWLVVAIALLYPLGLVGYLLVLRAHPRSE